MKVFSAIKRIKTKLIFLECFQLAIESGIQSEANNYRNLKLFDLCTIIRTLFNGL